MKLSGIDFSIHKYYHDVLITSIDLSEAEGVLTEEHRKYLRTAAKEKTGQALGAGAPSSAAKGVYNMMVKQAVRRAFSATLQTHTWSVHGASQPFGALVLFTGCQAIVEGEAQRRSRQRHKPPD
jgi:hypothetical protein